MGFTPYLLEGLCDFIPVEQEFPEGKILIQILTGHVGSNDRKCNP